jgi:hypothetical protein
VCSSQNNTGAIESWKMDWTGRMHAREDKIAQHTVYCLGAKILFFFHGFLVQDLLPLLTKSQFLGAFTCRREMCLSASFLPSLSVCLSQEGFALNFMFETFIKMHGEI